MTHQSIIAYWQKEAETVGDHYLRFFRWLKTLNKNKVDRLAREVHVEVFQTIDCLQCTNCCRTLKPEFREKEQHAVSEYLGLTVEHLQTTYLEQNEQGNWQTNTLPCPFLADTGHCRIYEVRPSDCRGFPHTDKPSFASRSWPHRENAVTCPAVFAILETLQERMGYEEE